MEAMDGYLAQIWLEHSLWRVGMRNGTEHENRVGLMLGLEMEMERNRKALKDMKLYKIS
jgi:hypothetical protein